MSGAQGLWRLQRLLSRSSAGTGAGAGTGTGGDTGRDSRDTSMTASDAAAGPVPDHEPAKTEEQWRKETLKLAIVRMGQGQPHNERVDSIQMFRDHYLPAFRLEGNLHRVWYTVADLIHHSDRRGRYVVWGLMCDIIVSHRDRLGPLKEVFLEVIIGEESELSPNMKGSAASASGNNGNGATGDGVKRGQAQGQAQGQGQALGVGMSEKVGAGMEGVSIGRRQNENQPEDSPASANRAQAQSPAEGVSTPHSSPTSALSAHTGPLRDYGWRRKALELLTRGYKELEPMSERVLGVLTRWLECHQGDIKEVVRLIRSFSALALSSFNKLSEEKLSEMIHSVCRCVVVGAQFPVVASVVEFLDACMRVGYIPPSALLPAISVLCSSINVQVLMQDIQRVVRNILRGRVSHRAVQTMCNILQDSSHYSKPALMRGVVFILGAYTWGSKTIPTLKIPFANILPYLQRALRSQSQVVTHEVVMALMRLLSKHGDSLVVEWEYIVDILIQVFPSALETKEIGENVTTISSVIAALHKRNPDAFQGLDSLLLKLLHGIADLRSIEATLLLLQLEGKRLSPLSYEARPNRLVQATKLVRQYLVLGKEQVIRRAAAELAIDITQQCYGIFEDEAVEDLVLPLFAHRGADPDRVVRDRMVRMVVLAATTYQHPRKIEHLIRALETALRVNPIVTRGRGSTGSAEPSKDEDPVLSAESETRLVAAGGLVQVFQIYLQVYPGTIAEGACELMLRHSNSADAGVRREIWQCLSELRATSHRYVVLPSAPYGPSSLHVPHHRVKKDESASASASTSSTSATANDKKVAQVAAPAPKSVVYLRAGKLSVVKLLGAIFNRIREEPHADILALILRGLAGMLFNKFIFPPFSPVLQRLVRLYTFFCRSLSTSFEDFTQNILDIHDDVTEVLIYELGFRCLEGMCGYGFVEDFTRPHHQLDAGRDGDGDGDGEPSSSPAGAVTETEIPDPRGAFLAGLAAQWPGCSHEGHGPLRRTCMRGLTLCLSELGTNSVPRRLPQDMLRKIGERCSHPSLGKPLLSYLASIGQHYIAVQQVSRANELRQRSQAQARSRSRSMPIPGLKGLENGKTPLDVHEDGHCDCYGESRKDNDGDFLPLSVTTPPETLFGFAMSVVINHLFPDTDTRMSAPALFRRRLAEVAFRAWFLSSSYVMRQSITRELMVLLKDWHKKDTMLLAISDFVERFSVADVKMMPSSLPEGGLSAMFERDVVHKTWLLGDTSVVTVKCGRFGWAQIIVRGMNHTTSMVTNIQNTAGDFLARSAAGCLMGMGQLCFLHDYGSSAGIRSVKATTGDVAETEAEAESEANAQTDMSGSVSEKRPSQVQSTFSMHTDVLFESGSDVGVSPPSSPLKEHDRSAMGMDYSDLKLNAGEDDAQAQAETQVQLVGAATAPEHGELESYIPLTSEEDAELIRQASTSLCRAYGWSGSGSLIDHALSQSQMGHDRANSASIGSAHRESDMDMDMGMGMDAGNAVILPYVSDMTASEGGGTGTGARDTPIEALGDYSAVTGTGTGTGTGTAAIPIPIAARRAAKPLPLVMNEQREQRRSHARNHKHDDERDCGLDLGAEGLYAAPAGVMSPPRIERKAHIGRLAMFGGGSDGVIVDGGVVIDADSDVDVIDVGAGAGGGGGEDEAIEVETDFIPKVKGKGKAGVVHVPPQYGTTPVEVSEAFMDLPESTLTADMDQAWLEAKPEKDGVGVRIPPGGVADGETNKVFISGLSAGLDAWQQASDAVAAAAPSDRDAVWKSFSEMSLQKAARASLAKMGHSLQSVPPVHRPLTPVFAPVLVDTDEADPVPVPVSVSAPAADIGVTGLDLDVKAKSVGEAGVGGDVGAVADADDADADAGAEVMSEGKPNVYEGVSLPGESEGSRRHGRSYAVLPEDIASIITTSGSADMYLRQEREKRWSQQSRRHRPSDLSSLSEVAVALESPRAKESELECDLTVEPEPQVEPEDNAPPVFLPEFVMQQFLPTLIGNGPASASAFASMVTPLQPGKALEDGLRRLDYVICSDIYKCGVIYVGRREANMEGPDSGAAQSDPVELLQNSHGSPRYDQFLRQIGHVVKLRDYSGYTGGLDNKSDEDGEYALVWSDPLMQIAYHVVTMMPSGGDNEQLGQKKRLIGNDMVNIVFLDCDNLSTFDPATSVTGHNFVQIWIRPVEDHSYVVNIWRNPKYTELPEFGPIEDKCVLSDRSIGTHIRLTIQHAFLAAETTKAVRSAAIAGLSPAAFKPPPTWSQSRLEAIRRLRDVVPAAPPFDNSYGYSDVHVHEYNKDQFACTLSQWHVKAPPLPSGGAAVSEAEFEDQAQAQAQAEIEVEVAFPDDKGERKAQNTKKQRQKQKQKQKQKRSPAQGQVAPEAQLEGQGQAQGQPQPQLQGPVESPAAEPLKPADSPIIAVVKRVRGGSIGVSTGKREREQKLTPLRPKM